MAQDNMRALIYKALGLGHGHKHANKTNMLAMKLLEQENEKRKWFEITER